MWKIITYILNYACFQSEQDDVDAMKDELIELKKAVSKGAEFEEKNKALSAENAGLLQQKKSGKKMFQKIKAEKTALEAELKAANAETRKLQATCDKIKKDIEKLNDEKTSKRKESSKSKLANPIRRPKRDPPSSPRQESNSSQDCVQQ